jgi:hypothetical protein
MGPGDFYMPFHYMLDDTGRRIRLTPSDPVTAAEMIEILDRQLADGAWGYGTLVDARGIFSPTASTDLQAFMEHFRELIAAHGPRGPLVVVTRTSGVIGTTQKYALLGGTAGRDFDVFWDVSDAENWLGARMV